MSETLDSMVRAAVQAAEIIKAVYSSDFTVDFKSPGDPVTQADRLANAAICRHLQQEFPGVPVVAEESEPSQFAAFRDSDRIFFVDPLDGTREFVAKNGEFVVMIGLVQGERATHGVVLSPTRDCVWAGELGHGAHRIDHNGVRQSLAPGQAQALINTTVVVSRSHRSLDLESVLQTAQVGHILPLGSAGLKAASVAEGTCDAYVALGAAGRRWDVCGPDALVHAAGGNLTDSKGCRFDYRHQDLTNSQGIIAANPLLHAHIVQCVHTASDEDHSHGKHAG